MAISQRQLIVVAVVSTSLLGALAVTTPFASEPTRNTEVILPAYAAAMAVMEIMTCTLLLALYNVQRSPALVILASGYLFSALLVPAWALTFPGVFTTLGLDFGLQATAAIAAVRRLSFPLFVLGYALAPTIGASGRPAPGAIAKSVVAVCAAAALCVWLILDHSQMQPNFMRDDRNVNELWRNVPRIALALYVIDMGILLARRRNSLDIWVCLVLFSLIIELLLISYLGGAVRLGIGWWAGRLYGLTAASIVLVVLLSETTAVYTRLAGVMAAERRARQNRLIAMEALSASIAHEINQPLASMITNADAALRWLSKDEPRIDKVDAALLRIVDDGHRANKVVAGIRTMFMKGAQERAALDVNALVQNAVRTASAEARYEGILIETELEPALSPVIGNSVQLHQVLCNLIENGIDAIKAAGDPPRRLLLRTGRLASGDVEVSVADSGTGIAAEVEERIFDPFVSTKPGGMGMGLMFCRSIVEAHGGRLWTSPNHPRGAIFHFSLPSDAFDPSTAEGDQ
ncbi:ATP-binding protein [Xanthobacter sp. DSM 24535]|uniref:ATP-binding protein n=1 Tax=Roseixanthobacter psychrophilus TaxID=3119917 RepID=UPI00372CBFCE